MKDKLTIISPVSLLMMIWVLTLLVASLPFAFPDKFDIANQLLDRQGLTSEDFTPMAAFWLIIAFLVFVCANSLTMMAQPRQSPAFNTTMDLNRMARAAVIVNVVFIAITLLWVLLSAQRMGGFRSMLVLVQLDVLEAREVLLDNKLFTGMRLIYATLPATGAIAVTILAAHSRLGGLSGFNRRLCQVSFGVTLVLLALLPIVMSQRLLLLQLIMAAYFSTCMVHRRLVGLQYVPIGLALFMSTWIARESLSNATLEASALEIGFEKLIFYFSNDLLNSFMPFNREFEHTYGFFSFKFLTYFTQTDGFFRSVLADRLDTIENIRGGGAWSVLTMPYVDFGAFGAALYIATLAVISAVVFYKGPQNVMWAALYGHFAGAYVLCTHTMYFANTNFASMLMVTVFIGSFAWVRESERTKQAPSPAE